MTDCLRTLHTVLRDPDELAAARTDIFTAWVAALVRPRRAARERLVATGAAGRRLRCPRAQKIVDQTEKDWSEKC